MLESLENIFQGKALQEVRRWTTSAVSFAEPVASDTVPYSGTSPQTSFGSGTL